MKTQRNKEDMLSIMENKKKKMPAKYVEIDIDLLMKKPSSIKKMMRKESCYDEDDEDYEGAEDEETEHDDSEERYDDDDSSVFDKPYGLVKKYLKNRLPDEKYEEYKLRWNNHKKKPKAVALNKLLGNKGVRAMGNFADKYINLGILKDIHRELDERNSKPKR